MRLLQHLGLGLAVWLAVALVVALAIAALNWRRNADLARLEASRAKIQAMTAELAGRSASGEAEREEAS
jgi:hypothetical protein